MIRLGRMTDYAVVVMGHMARRPGELVTTVDVAAATGLPVPTVSKLLHRLSDLHLLAAHRGRYGGYVLEQAARDIPLSAIVKGFEGPIALTDCLDGETGGGCGMHSSCAVAGRWQVVANAIEDVFQRLSLADMISDSPCAKAMTPMSMADLPQPSITQGPTHG
jgi:FeS assembly SUF system regulator